MPDPREDLRATEESIRRDAEQVQTLDEGRWVRHWSRPALPQGLPGRRACR
jgi:hypothetical protein